MTTSVDQVVAAADATDAIVNGFKVSVPAPPAAAPPAHRRRPARRPRRPGRRAATAPRRPAQPTIGLPDKSSSPGRSLAPGGTPNTTRARRPRIVWPMFIVAVLCLCAAVAIAALGVWLLTRPRSG